MNFEVVNREICVGNIQVIGVSSSSFLMVGDTNSIQLTSLFDTPPESLIIGPFVPLAPQCITRMFKRIIKSPFISNQFIGSCLYSSKLVIQTKLMVLPVPLLYKEKENYFLEMKETFNLFEIFSYPLPLPPIDEPLTIQTTSLQSNH